MMMFVRALAIASACSSLHPSPLNSLLRGLVLPVQSSFGRRCALALTAQAQVILSDTWAYCVRGTGPLRNSWDLRRRPLLWRSCAQGCIAVSRLVFVVLMLH